jgi:hypothetical protein
MMSTVKTAKNLSLEDAAVIRINSIRKSKLFQLLKSCKFNVNVNRACTNKCQLTVVRVISEGNGNLKRFFFFTEIEKFIHFVL